ncbi:MAG: MFS transporter, partial [Bacteroidales bacterium]|nr:MFS transporter [Bacteroidales bacterium]
MKFLAPPPHKEQLPKDQIDKTYKRLRLQVFLGVFIGYAAYYLVRKNLALAAPDMIATVEAGGLGYTKAQIGIAMSASSMAYAFSKFIMGSLSDRSNARSFMVVGLLLAAGVMLAVGLFPFVTASLAWLFVFMFLAGWISGMGWPPCGRTMAHWFSHSERSFKMSIWNCSHTLGSGLLGNFAMLGVVLIGGWFCFTLPGGAMIDQSWRAVFVFPAMVAVVLALFCWWALRDTPQSCGLPPVAEWRNDPSPVKEKAEEKIKIPFARLFVDYIFKNRILWMLALANAFVYFVRYG